MKIESIDTPQADQLVRELKELTARGSWGGFYSNTDLQNDLTRWLRDGTAEGLRRISGSYLGPVTRECEYVHGVHVDCSSEAKERYDAADARYTRAVEILRAMGEVESNQEAAA